MTQLFHREHLRTEENMKVVHEIAYDKEYRKMAKNADEQIL